MRTQLDYFVTRFTIDLDAHTIWEVLTDPTEHASLMFGAVHISRWQAGDPFLVAWNGDEVASGEIVEAVADCELQYRLDDTHGDCSWISWKLDLAGRHRTTVTLTLDSLQGEICELGPILAERFIDRLQDHRTRKGRATR